MPVKISAEPFDFPLAGALAPDNTALMVIDFQVDFCAKGGYIDRRGIDLAPLRRAIAPARKVLGAMRECGFTVVHTRETFSPDLSDVQPHRLFRGVDGKDTVVGDEGSLGRCLIHGERCWQLIPELAPFDGEAIFDKSSYGAFASTEIDAYLRQRDTKHIVLVGLTTNCCITSNLREALDRGYECLVLEDCCGATSERAHDDAIRMMRSPSGVFGTLSDARRLLEALGKLTDR